MVSKMLQNPRSSFLGLILWIVPRPPNLSSRWTRNLAQGPLKRILGSDLKRILGSDLFIATLLQYGVCVFNLARKFTPFSQISCDDWWISPKISRDLLPSNLAIYPSWACELPPCQLNYLRASPFSRMEKANNLVNLVNTVPNYPSLRK